MLDEDGEITVSAQPLRPLAEPLCYAVSDRPVSSGDRFLYHKTTRRGFYDEELARLRAATDCDEVLFVNERGELTEGSWTNLFVRRGRKLLTPPVACGLLDGALRRELLQTRPGEVEEAVLRRKTWPVPKPCFWAIPFAACCGHTRRAVGACAGWRAASVAAFLVYRPRDRQSGAVSWSGC